MTSAPSVHWHVSPFPWLINLPFSSSCPLTRETSSWCRSVGTRNPISPRYSQWPPGDGVCGKQRKRQTMTGHKLVAQKKTFSFVSVVEAVLSSLHRIGQWRFCSSSPSVLHSCFFSLQTHNLRTDYGCSIRPCWGWCSCCWWWWWWTLSWLEAKMVYFFLGCAKSVTRQSIISRNMATQNCILITLLLFVNE